MSVVLQTLISGATTLARTSRAAHLYGGGGNVRIPNGARLDCTSLQLAHCGVTFECLKSSERSGYVTSRNWREILTLCAVDEPIFHEILREQGECMTDCRREA